MAAALEDEEEAVVETTRGGPSLTVEEREVQQQRTEGDCAEKRLHSCLAIGYPQQFVAI